MNENSLIRSYFSLPIYLQVSSHGAWKPAPHLMRLCQALEQIDMGITKRLIVNMPPRHGKSEVISKGFPSWYLGRHPDHEIILSCYGAELAEDFSRINREKFREFGENIFGVKINRTSSAVGRWGIEGHKGGLVAAGVNGPLTGRGAHIAIIDDPIKSAMEANSETYRSHLLEWYQTVLRTRLAPGGAIILVQTRWTKEDLAGKLIQRGNAGGEKWTVLNMPAISESGTPDDINRPPNTALWPERYPLNHLLQIQSTLTPYQWSALYQQQPTDYEGALWTYANIDNYRYPEDKPLPNFVSIVVGVDPSGGADATAEGGEHHDEAGIIVVAKDEKGHYYILDDRSGSRSPYDTARETVATYKKYNADSIIIEVNFGGDMMRDLIRTVDKTPAIQAVTASRSKRIRAEPITSLYNQGLVHHVGTFSTLEKQLCSWTPLAKHSPDRMDALVWGITYLSQTKTYCNPILTTGGRL